MKIFNKLKSLYYKFKYRNTKTTQLETNVEILEVQPLTGSVGLVYSINPEHKFNWTSNPDENIKLLRDWAENNKHLYVERSRYNMMHENYIRRDK